MSKRREPVFSQLDRLSGYRDDWGERDKAWRRQHKKGPQWKMDRRAIREVAVDEFIEGKVTPEEDE